MCSSGSSGFSHHLFILGRRGQSDPCTNQSMRGAAGSAPQDREWLSFCFPVLQTLLFASSDIYCTGKLLYTFSTVLCLHHWAGTDLNFFPQALLLHYQDVLSVGSMQSIIWFHSNYTKRRCSALTSWLPVILHAAFTSLIHVSFSFISILNKHRFLRCIIWNFA